MGTNVHSSRLAVSGLCALLLAGGPLEAGGPPPVAVRLEALVPRLMKDGDVPGLSVAVIRDSAVLWQRGFGVKRADTKEPVGDDTVFEAASLSKPVFAYAVLRLVERGTLDLDAPLTRYVPGHGEDDPRLDLITARRVLTHTTGFPNWRPRGEPLRIHFTPGERFSYSGEGFVYLQKAVERVTGRPLDAVMKEVVFEPLGMTSSSYVWQERFAERKATGHDQTGTPTEMRKPTEANAAASLNTTAGDYARFVIAILNGTGLKRASLDEMLRPQVWVDEACQSCTDGNQTGRLSRSVAWGLGWGLQRTEDGLSFWHWGDNNGDVHCYVVGVPREKSGVVVFTNSGNGHGIIPEIVSAALGGKQPAIAWLNYERYDSPARTWLKDILARGESAITAYAERRKSLSPGGRLSEAQTNRLGYGLLARKRTKEAIRVFEMNAADFPESWNVHDSLGEAYALDGRKAEAIRSYERSLALNPKNANGADALKELRGEAPGAVPSPTGQVVR